MITYYYIEGDKVKYITLSPAEYGDEAKTKTLYLTAEEARKATA